ncbi:MAG: hypothetical protein JRN68_00505 [Nitrososphaerota archaeon]|jgi:hypothetical protein|nr:hypothetical protein [Nitrososphaerota archaeon]
MKFTLFSAMALGVLLAAMLLVWEEVGITLRGSSSFSNALWFTVFSLLAILVFVVFMARAPDND